MWQAPWRQWNDRRDDKMSEMIREQEKDARHLWTDALLDCIADVPRALILRVWQRSREQFPHHDAKADDETRDNRAPEYIGRRSIEIAPENLKCD